MSLWLSAAATIVWVLTFLAIVCLLVAAVELIRESRLSLDIIQTHSRHIETEAD